MASGSPFPPDLVGVSSGSDVFVWRVGWAQAQAVTTSHADLFAGWFGAQILFSEFSQADSETSSTPSTSPPAAGATNTAAAAAPVAGAAPVTAISYVYDPRIAEVWQIDRPMLMPVVDPTGTFVVYWAGTVAFDQADRTVRGRSGRLLLRCLVQPQPGRHADGRQ